MKSPSSSASSTVSSSVAGAGSDVNLPAAPPMLSKQQNLLHSVVGALLEETRLAAAAQAATTYRKSKSAIITPSRPFNEGGVSGVFFTFDYSSSSISVLVTLLDSFDKEMWLFTSCSRC
jgi:hypothetical protein